MSRVSSWRIWALLLVGVVVGPLLAQDPMTSAPTSSSNPPNPEERPASAEGETTFPRWLPTWSFDQACDIHVQHNGVAHVVSTTPTVYYSNNRWETRTENGFAEPVPIGSSMVNSGRISSTGEGEVAIVWIDDSYIGMTINGIPYYRPSGDVVGRRIMRVGAALAWDPLLTVGGFPNGPQLICNSRTYVGQTVQDPWDGGGSGGNPYFSEFHLIELEYGQPDIHYDDMGMLHMAVARREREWHIEHIGFMQGNPPQLVWFESMRELVRDERYICYRADPFGIPGDPPVVVQGRVSDGDYPLGRINEADPDTLGPLVRGGRDGNPRIMWVRRTVPPLGGPRDALMHTITTDPARFREIDFEQPAPGLPPGIRFWFNLAVSPDAEDAEDHIVWIRGMEVKYRRRIVDQLSNPVTLPWEAEEQPSDPAVVVDGQRRPHVTWRIYEVGQNDLEWLGYARATDDPTNASSWTIQWPMQTPATTVNRTMTFDNYDYIPATRLWYAGEAVHDFHKGCYTPTAEYYLGEQDGYLMHAAGKRGRVNAATGNLGIAFPLFAANDGPFPAGTTVAYNTLDWYPGPSAMGVTTSNTIMIMRNRDIPEADITLRLGDGRSIIFQYDDSYDYHIALDEFGIFARLELNGNPVITFKDRTTYTFNPLTWKIASIQDESPTRNIMSFNYGANGASTWSDDIFGIPETMLMTTVDSAGRQTTFAYDNNERLAMVTDPMGETYGLTYIPGDTDRPDRLMQLRAYAVVGTWSFEYHTDDDEVPGSQIGSNYHRMNHVYRLTSPLGYMSEYTYLRDGRLRTAFWPSTMVMSENGPVPDVDRPRIVLSYTENSGNTTKAFVRNPREFNTEIEYERKRCLALKIKPGGGGDYIEREFDTDYRNLMTFRDMLGNETTYEYFLMPGQSTPDYVMNNLKRVTMPAGSSGTAGNVQYTYTQDGFNNVATVIDAEGRETEYSYNGAGQLTSINHPEVTPAPAFNIGAGNFFEMFDRDQRGRVNLHTNVQGTASIFDYVGTSHNPTQKSSPGGSTENFMYNGLGQVIQHVRTPGVTTDYTYNSQHLVRLRTDPGPGGQRNVTQHTYDAEDRLTRVEDSMGLIAANTWDSRGLLASTSNALNQTISFVYDRNGNLRRREDARGNYEWTYYNAMDRVREAILDGSAPFDSLYHHQVFAYDANGNVIEKQWGSPNNISRMEYAYDDKNCLEYAFHASYVDADGKTPAVKVQRNRNDQVKEEWIGGAVSNQMSTVLSNRRFDLDEWGRTREVRVAIADRSDRLPSNGSQQFANLAGSVNGVQNSMANSGWLTTSVAFNPASQVTTVLDPSGRWNGATYDPFCRPVDQVDGEGRALQRSEYDNGGRVIRQNHQNPLNPNPPPGAGSLTQNLQVSYLPGSDWVQRQGFDVSSEYQYFHDIRGRVTQMMDPRGAPTIYEYDALNRITRVIRLEKDTRYAYDPNGNLASVTVYNPDTGAVSSVYGYSYDNANRRIQATYPSGAIETWAYNSRGLVSGYEDANDNVVVFGYDGMDRLVLEDHQTMNRRVTREYDNSSRMTAIVSRTWDGQEWDELTRVAFSYDTAGRVLEKGVFVGGQAFRSVVYFYDEGGNRIALIAAGSVQAETRYCFYQWSPGSRLDRITRFDASLGGAISADFDYDSGGRLLLTSLAVDDDEQLRIVRQYNNRAFVTRVRSETEQMSLRSQYDYTYDIMGNRMQVSMAHLDNMTVAYTYDLHNQLTSESWSGAQVAGVTVSPYWASYTYDPGGNRTSKLTSNGWQMCDYSSASRLTEETTSTFEVPEPAGVEASSTESGYSAAVIIDGGTESSPAWRSVESGAQHVVTVDLGSVQTVAGMKVFTPSGVGNMGQFRMLVDLEGTWNVIVPRMTVGATPHAQNEWWVQTNREVEFGITPVQTRYVRFVQASGGGGSSPNIAWLNEIQAVIFDTPQDTDYTYDDAGNLTQKVRGTTRETFGYDHKNRMSSYLKESNASGSWVTLEQVVHDYLPTGERHLRHILVQDGDEEDDREWFLHDGDDVVLDYTQVGENDIDLAREYMNGLGIDSKIARIDAVSGDGFFYVPDALGSVREMTDLAGTIVNRQFTTAWGEMLPGVTVENDVTDRHGFAQREHEPESGLVYMRNRMYDPRIGRFSQLDPVFGNRPGEHYVYAVNNPIKHKDPMGLQVTDEDRETWRQMVIRMWNAKAKGNASLFYNTKNDMKFFANQLIKAQGKTEYDAQIEAQNMLRQVLAVPDLTVVKPTLSQINEELGYLNSIGDSLRETIASLETQYEVAWWVDKGSTVISMLAGAGYITAGAKAAFTQGGAKALFSYLAKEGGKIGVGVAVDQSGVLDQVSNSISQMSGLTPTERDAVYKMFGVIKGMIAGRTGSSGAPASSGPGSGAPVSSMVQRRAPARLPANGKPNSSASIDNGAGKGQIRDYGPDGRAKKDIDFGHDHGAGDPHVHDWDWNQKPPRGPGRPVGAND